MVITVAAIYERGLLRLKEPVPLQDNAEVRVVIDTAPCEATSTTEGDPTGWSALQSLVGIVEDAPPDMAENHDHYLYGFPRR